MPWCAVSRSRSTSTTPTASARPKAFRRRIRLGKDPQVKPYDIPYGCLVPRRVNGLLVAGRCISGSHEAMASYRVQVIAMGMGVAAGVAAAQAAQQNIEPRDVDVSGIQQVVFETL